MVKNDNKNFINKNEITEIINNKINNNGNETNNIELEILKEININSNIYNNQIGKQEEEEEEEEFIISKNDYNLLFSLYNSILNKVPARHKKKKSIIPFKNYNNNNNNENINKYYFYGYEFIEWIIISKNNNIDRDEATKLSQAMLMLFLIKNSKQQNQKISGSKFIFHDDRTCYCLSNSKYFQSYSSYNQYLKQMYKLYNSKNIKLPNPSNLIHTIFSKITCDCFNKINNKNNNNNTTTPCTNKLCHKQEPQQQLQDLKIPYNNNDDIVSPPQLESLSNSSSNLITMTMTKGEDITDENNIEIGEVINSHFTNDAELDPSIFSWSKNVPLFIFLIVLSTSALGIQHRLLSVVFNYPSLIYKIIACIAALFWISAFILLLGSSIYNWKYTIRNIRWSLHVTVFASVSMSLLQISDLSISLGLTFAKVIFWIAFSLQSISVTTLYYQIIVRLKRGQPLSISPTFIFSGAAFIIMSSTSYHLGYPIAFSWVFFGYGMVFCLIIQFSLLASYIRSARNGIYLKFDQMATQNILIGFASLGFASIVSLENRLSVFGRYLFLLIFINYFIVVSLWIIIIVHSNPNLPVKFNLGYWGNGFPILSMATSSLIYYHYTPYTSTKIIAFFLLGASNTVYLVLIGLTLYYAFNKNLFIISRKK